MGPYVFILYSDILKKRPQWGSVVNIHLVGSHVGEIVNLIQRQVGSDNQFNKVAHTHTPVSTKK